MVQILNGGAACQQIDSEEEDEQEAEADSEVSMPTALMHWKPSGYYCLHQYAVPLESDTVVAFFEIAVLSKY